MRIGIDARELGGRPTGVGRYLRSLIGEWAADERSPHEFVLYTPAALDLPLDGRRFPSRLVKGGSGTWWEQVRLPLAAMRDHLDVFFSPAYTAPLRLNVPFVVTIHDISFHAHPEWFRLREGARRRWLTKRAARHARSIIAVSAFTKRELVERLGINESRIKVVYSGIAPGASGNSQSPTSVLYVGSIFNRRHVTDLIRAFAVLARRVPHVTLDIVGDNRSYPREDVERTIAAEGVHGQARWHSYASDADLARLYANARAFAFLSEYEGFGMTPLEALAAGVPPLVADTPIARESCGDAAAYVPIGDLPATTAALERLLFDDDARRRILSAAPSVLSRYEWSLAARQTMDILEAARG
jgi:glycosyltransferase involved in cell wall biosynthesis